MSNVKQNGFTLMEMLIVVTIIGILAAIVLPRFITSSGQARQAAHRAERQTINAQLELYYFTNSAYPIAGGNGNLSGWTSNFVDYFPEGVPSACNQSSAWVLSNGRVVEHSGHE